MLGGMTPRLFNPINDAVATVGAESNSILLVNLVPGHETGWFGSAIRWNQYSFSG